MARKERYQELGNYHIINRGVERRNVYLEESDFYFFIELMQKISKEFSLTIDAFCLMSNHYHILLETKKANLSKAIQYLNDKYSKYFNKKYKRVGALWQGRYKSYPLFDDAHFWIVAKYIERNPIKASMVKSVDEYPYQSYYIWKNKTEYYELIKDSKIFDMLFDEYSEYINSEQDSDAIDIVYDSPKLLVRDGEIRLLTKRLMTFFHEDSDIGKDENIKQAYKYGYTKSEIAKFLSLSHNSVSKIIG